MHLLRARERGKAWRIVSHSFAQAVYTTIQFACTDKTAADVCIARKVQPNIIIAYILFVWIFVQDIDAHLIRKHVYLWFQFILLSSVLLSHLFALFQSRSFLKKNVLVDVLRHERLVLDAYLESVLIPWISNIYLNLFSTNVIASLPKVKISIIINDSNI